MKNSEPKRLSITTHLKNNPIDVKRNLNLSNPYELHWHDFFEIEIITGGRGIQILNGKEYELKRGTVTVLTTTDFHELKMRDNVDSYNISIDESVIPQKTLDKILNTNDNIICCLDGIGFDKILHLAELLHMENDFDDEQYIKNLVDCMITLILKNTKKSNKPAAMPSKLLIHKASVYMRMHFREKLPLSSIASYVNLNPSYFCRFFTNEIGMSPKKYLSELRLKYARKLLITTSITVTEVCFACGYTSLSNFLKAFKLKYAMTPKQVREINRGV